MLQNKMLQRTVVKVLFCFVCRYFFVGFVCLIIDSKKYSTETQGNYFRYVALLSVCVDALRKAFDNLPDTFEEKNKQIQEALSSSSGKLKIEGAAFT